MRSPIPRSGRLLVCRAVQREPVPLAAGRAAVSTAGLVDRRRAEVGAARDAFAAELGAAGVETVPSQANFVLVQLGVDDGPVYEGLLGQGVLVRAGATVGLPGYIRVTMAPAPLMRAATREIVAALEPGMTPGLDTAARVMARANKLAACTERPGGITRRYGTPALVAARGLLDGWMRAAGMTTRVDRVGNLIGSTAAGGARPVIVVGSRFDTVVDAGR